MIEKTIHWSDKKQLTALLEKGWTIRRQKANYYILGKPKKSLLGLLGLATESLIK